MSQINRKAPNSEWVHMYRQGIPSPKIAAVVGAAETTVRYHLAIAARQDPTLRSEHKAAVQPAPRVTQTGRQNLEDILALYQAQRRLPVAGRSKRESALAGWLVRRRRQAADGTLSSAYAEALEAIPGWREYPTKQDSDEARWRQRLGEVADYLAAGNELPRHSKTDDREERTLGVWLHTQRIDHRAGKLTLIKEILLNETIPGWRKGRPRRGANGDVDRTENCPRSP